MIDPIYGIDKRCCLSNELWKRIEPLIPPPKEKKVSGRQRMDDRRAMTAILYVLRNGCQWRAIPMSLGAGSTVHASTRAALQLSFAGYSARSSSMVSPFVP